MNKIISFLILFFTILLIFASTILIKYSIDSKNHRKDKTVLYYYSKGMAAYNKKDYPLFVKYLKKAVELAPFNPNLLYNLARAYAIQGNKDESLKLLQQCVDLGFYFNSVNSAFNEREFKDFNNIRETDAFKVILNKIQRMNTPIINSETAFNISEKDLMPEGIAYDPIEQAFYIGSGYKRKIISIDKKGSITNFTAEGQDGIWNVWGLKVDAKRRILWANSSPWYGMKGFKKNYFGHTGVFKYDLTKNILIKKYIIDERPVLHEFNDLVINSRGDVFITDDLFGAIYKISQKTDELKLFLKPNRFTYPNGITLSQDERYLYIAHKEGVLVVNLRTKSYYPLSHPTNLSLCDIDGIYFYQNSLIAIQGTNRPPRLVRFYLNDKLLKVDRAEIIESGNPLLMLPTTGVIIGDTFFYIANSQLNCYSKENKIFPLDKLHNIFILKTGL